MPDHVVYPASRATRSGDLDIRQSTAQNIMALSFPLEGKKQACACGAIPPIVYLLEGSARPPTATDAAKWFGVVSAAAGALMSITVTTEGKKLAIKAKARKRAVQQTLSGQSSWFLVSSTHLPLRPMGAYVQMRKRNQTNHPNKTITTNNKITITITALGRRLTRSRPSWSATTSG